MPEASKDKLDLQRATADEIVETLPEEPKSGGTVLRVVGFVDRFVHPELGEVTSQGTRVPSGKVKQLTDAARENGVTIEEVKD